MEGISLPGRFGLGFAFIPPWALESGCRAVQSAARRAGIQFLGTRHVPVDPSVLGPKAAATLPAIRQFFFAPGRSTQDFERSLFLLRKRIEAESPDGLYFCSLSSRTVVYKGLLVPWQLAVFYPDLSSPEFTAPFAVFHQRYSTNTRPSWSLAQPFRCLAHNGEINTIGANRRWMRARAAHLRKELRADARFSALEEGVSDSASLDNALEVTLQQGYSVSAAMSRLVPPAWESDPAMEPAMGRFLDSAAWEQEPWDGPAALVFTDGRQVGAKLDRNGLRPLRYTLTADGLVIAGSEVGLADLADKQVVERQRLGPGEMLLVDAARGKIYRNGGLAGTLASPAARQPRRCAPVSVLPSPKEPEVCAPQLAPQEWKRSAAAYGWTDDQHRLLFFPLGSEGKEAVWSMGDDAPPAFLSAVRRPLWDYCKQRFAQVTNPPIDPLRESHVMSLDVRLGRRALLPSPVADAIQMKRLRRLFPRVREVDFTFEASGGAGAAKAALDRVRREAGSCAARDGMIVLTDRSLCERRAALPALLAVAAAWKAMVRAGLWHVPLLIESGQVIETHHVALLVAAGASAVHPFLALELAERASAGGADRYRQAVDLGLRKVLARMGISCISSYRNSQLFEVVGIAEEVCSEFLEDATAVFGSRLLAELLADCVARHRAAFSSGAISLHDAGLYRYRQGGERHASSPDVVRRLHQYIATPTEENYRAFAALAVQREPVAVRDLLDFAPAEPLPLGEVEDEFAILSRFSTQAMSLGALSPEAHRTLAVAMNRLGARSNTGEGGEDPDIYLHDPEAANRIKQVASARFGVTTTYLVHAHELEIKMAQGSKPGEGGQLPASKVTPYIARLRHAVAGMTLISPPPHHDIYSIEDLAQLIYDLREVNPRARIGVKLVSGAGVGLIAAGVAKAGADVISICGFDGGTGASPLTSIKNTGLPWEAGLSEAHGTLLRAGLRERVRLRVDGGLKCGRDVVFAALLGADEFGFGTSALLAIGCVMARQCHLNTCPVGIATQDETLRLRFAGRPEMAVEYFRGVAREVREWLAQLGAFSLSEIRGHTQRLRVHPRAAAFTGALSVLLEPAPKAPQQISRAAESACGLHAELERLLDLPSEVAFAPRTFPIVNSDRATGARLSGELLRRRLAGKPAPRVVECEFRGAAGQSFGAFLVPGVHFRLTGEANDYVGKGLSGGAIAITAGPEASARGDVLAGNTVLYGATSGTLFIAGRAGERFAVRNSGALAVVEGVGHHGCEYMTAGVVVILGPAGKNFGSGMTGGLAYVPLDALRDDCYHTEFVRPAELDYEEHISLRRVLREHLRLTGSPRAKELLRRRGSLPLVRLEPMYRSSTIAETWAASLAPHRRLEDLLRAPAPSRQAEAPVPLEAVS
ncbi:MAG TPA: glutamate synthase large subunit [Candidatus Acidoferrales bacterium]|nr:glutamate synthase large subunit [Candidatus Acidoferrales bacterium]